MNIRRTFLSLLGLSLLAAAAFAAPPASNPQKTATAELGKPAPDFTLKDTTGKSHSLSDFRGKTVVLQWINPDCPFCRRVMTEGTVAKMLKDLKSIDENAVLLAINSTHYMDAKDTAQYLKKNKMDIPGLIDSDGIVGRLYDARTTPHVFVIDKNGILRYSGAIDDNARGSRGSDATNYAVNAARQLSAGEAVAPDKTRPYGCSVKYAKK